MRGGHLVAVLDGEPDGHGIIGIADFEAGSGQPRHGVESCHLPRGVRRQAAPGIGLGQIVHRVQRLADVAVGARGNACRDIRRDRAVPQAKPGEDMRRHVQRMRRGRRDLRVGTRCRQSSLRQLGTVIGKGQIVRHAGMIRLAPPDRLQDIGGTLLSRGRMVAC